MLYRAAQVAELDTSTRTVVVQLCAWNEPRPVADAGHHYREAWAPGSLHLAERTHVVSEHGGDLIGRAGDLKDTTDGPTVQLHIAHTRAGDDALALIDAGVVDAVSMEFLPDPDGEIVDGDLVTRTAATVHGVAFAFRPAHTAPILQRDETPMPAPMPDTLTLTAPASADVELRAELAELAAQVATLDRTAPSGVVRHRAAEFSSLGEYWTARRDDPSVPGNLLMRVLADQITTNNPGVVPPAWLSEVFGIVDAGRPVVTAFGVRPLPDSGMEVNWPYFDGDLSALVLAQATQKTAITSVRVDIKKGTEALETFAGGSDISYQLLRRSSPSYRDAYVRIMLAAYAATTDAAASAAALTAAATGPAADIADADSVRAALFAASSMVQVATGSPASFGLASTDVFGALGGNSGLYPAPYGTNNASGTADAASLTINVSGLPIIHAPYLTGPNLIVSNRQAGGWLEDGPMTAQAEDVEKLGQNVAVWGMGTFAAFLPLGIVKLVPTVPPPLAASTGSSSSRSSKS